MRIIVWAFFSLMLLTGFLGQAQELTREHLKFQPENIDQALKHIDVILDDSTQANFKRKPEGIAVSQMHYGFGLWMRNNWNLYEKKGKLSKFFRAEGIKYAADMSSILLALYHRKLNGIPLEEDKLIAFYKDYRENPDRIRANSRELTFEEKLPLIDENEWEEVSQNYEVGKTVEGYIYQEKKGVFSKEKIIVLSGKIIAKTDNTIKIELTTCSNPEKWPDGCGPGHILEVYPASWEVVELDFTDF
ncbi:MAG: DUF6794 domain-containing protein [Bacteroidota bacterium]